MSISAYEVTDQQRESCAVSVMRTMLEDYCNETGVSFDAAFFQFAASPVYKALFDYSTRLWTEGPDYLRGVFEQSLTFMGVRHWQEETVSKSKYTKNVLELLEQEAERFPNRPAFGDPQKDITFAELLQKARAVGELLAEDMGIESPAAFYLEKSVDAVIAMFGVVYAGGFYSFIDVRQPAARAQKVADVLEPAVFITDEANKERAEEIVCGGKRILLEELLEQAEKLRSRRAAEDDTAEEPGNTEFSAVGNLAGAEHTAAGRLQPGLSKTLAGIRSRMTDKAPLYVNFTSGSTGIPKGVAVCHRSVIEFMAHFVPLFGITEQDVMGNQAPFDFDVSVKDIYSGLAAGAKVQIIPREYFSNPTQLMDYLCEKKTTVLIWAVSAMCFVSIMNALDYKTPESVRAVGFSGEVMPIKQLNIWRRYLPDAMYVNLYGPTEITCNCTYYVLDPHKEYALDEVIPAGRAFENEKVFLLDEEDHLVPQTDTEGEGEICVGGTCVALGYYKDAERTAAAFVQNPLNTFYPERIYRTGDIGRYDEEGNLIYVSRKDFQIKHLGHRIELGEVEADAMARDGVSRACCIYDAAKKRLILFYTGERDRKDLERELKEVLPPFMVPNKTLQLEDMPLNKNGKIDRHALEDIYHGMSAGRTKS